MKFLTATGIKLAVATTLVCGATMGGYTTMALRSGSTTAPTSLMMPAVSKPTFTGAPCTAVTSGTGTTRALKPQAARSLTASGQSAAAAPVAAARSLTSSNSSSTALGALHTASSAAHSGSGGGGGGAAGGISGGSSAGSTAASSGGVMLAMATANSTSRSSAAAAPRRSGIAPQSDPGSGTMDVWTGDAPGIITCNENSVTDNPIVTNQTPVGDALWPLLCFALLFLLHTARKKRLASTIITKAKN